MAGYTGEGQKMRPGPPGEAKNATGARIKPEGLTENPDPGADLLLFT